MSGGPTYILHEMFFPGPLTNISSVIHMCPNKNWPQPQHSDRNAVGKCDQSQFSKKSKWFCSSYVIMWFSGAFTCLCFPPSSCIRSFKGTYHSSPGSFLIILKLDDFQSFRKSCLCWKVLYFTSKLFSSGQTSWLSKWVLSKVIFFCLPPFVNCVFLRCIDEFGEEGRLESNQGIHLLMFVGLLYNRFVFAGLLDVYLYVCRPFV